MYSIWISMTKNNVFFIKIHNHFGFFIRNYHTNVWEILNNISLSKFMRIMFDIKYYLDMFLGICFRHTKSLQL